MTPQLFIVIKRATSVMKRLDGLGLPQVARALATSRAYSDGTGKYLKKSAAITPPGLPIPGSAYTRKIAQTLLRRALPLPAQLLLELIEITRNPNAPPIIPTPQGWTLGCTNIAPSGSGGISNVILSTGKIGQPGCAAPLCVNNQALGAPAAWTGTITTTTQCRVSFLAPGSIGGRFDVMKVIAATAFSPADCFALCGPTTITQVPGMVPMRMRGPFNPDVELNPAPPPSRYNPGPKWNPRTTPKFTPRVDPDHWSPPVYPPPPASEPKTEPNLEPPPWRYIPPEWADPNLAPELVPPTAPSVEPPHRPFWAIPGTNTQPVFESPPRHGTERGPTPPRQEPTPPPAVVTLPGGATVIVPPPIRVPVTLGGPGVSVTINPPGSPPLVSRPPGPRNKERKLIVAIPAGALRRVIGGITEGMDMVDCLHDALPKHLQAKKLRKPPHAKGGSHFAKPSLKRKAAAVYKAFTKQADAIEGGIEHGITPNYVLSANDIMNAIVTCGQQQFMDRIYAEIGRAGGRAGRRLGMATGTGFGGSARSAVTFGV